MTPSPSKGRDGVTATEIVKRLIAIYLSARGHELMRDVISEMAMPIEQAIKEAREEGFLECQAKAVEIVKDWPGPGGIVMCDDLDSQGVLLGHRQGFIKAIESLHPKGGA